MPRPRLERPPVARAPFPPMRREFAPAPALMPPPVPPSLSPDDDPDPYLDYGRYLTAEGGILLCYKDLDQRLRHTLWRIFAWTVATGFEGWFLFHHSPVHSMEINILCLLACALINLLIVGLPVEIMRTIEIRPDCMILDGIDLFWMRYMECGWPSFADDEEGNKVLTGTYGTRFVEYLTALRFDELDRAPEVLASHLQDAMRTLWARADLLEGSRNKR